MSLIHDLIKIKYSKEGYLPDHPPHLISDREMCQAFLPLRAPFVEQNSWKYFFDTFYSCPDIALFDKWIEVRNCIQSELLEFVNSKDGNKTLPDWVYSYMLGEVISDNSTQEDKHDLFVLLGLDNQDDIFNGMIASRCYDISTYILRSNQDSRVPTIFGDTSIVKYLRLSDVGGV